MLAELLLADPAFATAGKAALAAGRAALAAGGDATPALLADTQSWAQLPLSVDKPVVR